MLDFYVFEETQRQGVGKKLFDFMIQDASISPHKLAYDRPSQKFINFLKKYFSLSCYIPQNNNFVVFNEYFDSSGVNTEETKYDTWPIKGSHQIKFENNQETDLKKTNINKNNWIQDIQESDNLPTQIQGTNLLLSQTKQDFSIFPWLPLEINFKNNLGWNSDQTEKWKNIKNWYCSEKTNLDLKESALKANIDAQTNNICSDFKHDLANNLCSKISTQQTENIHN